MRNAMGVTHPLMQGVFALLEVETKLIIYFLEQNSYSIKELLAHASDIQLSNVCHSIWHLVSATENGS